MRYRSLMVMPIHAPVGYLIAAGLIGVCLLISFFCFGTRYKRAILSRVIAAYIAVGSLMVCYTAFSVILLGLARDSCCRTLCRIAWSAVGRVVYESFFHLSPASPQGIGLCALAAANSSFGFILASRTGLTRLTAVTAAGCYTI